MTIRKVCMKCSIYAANYAANYVNDSPPLRKISLMALRKTLVDLFEVLLPHWLILRNRNTEIIKILLLVNGKKN